MPTRGRNFSQPVVLPRGRKSLTLHQAAANSQLDTISGLSITPLDTDVGLRVLSRLANYPLPLRHRGAAAQVQQETVRGLHHRAHAQLLGQARAFQPRLVAHAARRESQGGGGPA